MAITTEEFVLKFHSLTGTTVGERQKNLFHLLNQIKQSGSTNLDFSSIQPKTPLEEKLKVETLIYFRRISNLIELLKCENPILIHIILKHSWFLTEALKNTTGEQLVTLIFPHISFNTKVKILNKLSLYLKNPQQADEFYKAIEEKYGFYLASKLLTSCSSGLILNCVKMNRIKLTSRQLLIVIEKYPEIVEEVIKALSSRVDVMQAYAKTFSLIAKHDMPLFLKLHNDYKVVTRLGWRATNKFLKSNKQDIINSPNIYKDFLHKKQMVKSLGDDFQNFYINLFPETTGKFDQMHDLLFSLLKELPDSGNAVNLLSLAFNKSYGCELWEYPKYVTPALLKMLPPDERMLRLDTKYKPEAMSEDEWNCFWTTDKSIPYLKKRITVSSNIKTRAELVEYLVKTCEINKDKVALADVCKYMMKQHRNDHISVRLAFIKTLKKSFKLEHLEQEHWTAINELIRIFIVKDEPFYHMDILLEGYMHFCLMHDLPIKDSAIKWVNHCYHYQTLNMFKNKPQYEKKCLLTFGEVIPEIVAKDKPKEFWYTSFLRALVDWNTRHPFDTISLLAYKDAMDYFKGILKLDHIYGDPLIVITHLLKPKIDSEEKLNLLKICLSNSSHSGYLNILEHLIKCEPSLILENIQNVMGIVLKTNNTNDNCFIKYCRYYSHLKLPQAIVEICIDVTKKDRETFENKSEPQNAIITLSYLMPVNEFLKFVTPYYPSKQGKKLHAIQKDISKALKNIKPSSKALKTILTFCVGECFRLFQRALYSISGNTNEDKLVPFFKDLSTHSVSVKKHVLHLTFRNLDKQQIMVIFNHFMENKDASLIKFIFKSSFNLFLRNPSEYSWELLRLNMQTVDVNDNEVIEVLIQFDKVPMEYISKYIPLVWEILNQNSGRERHLDTERTTLLQFINSDIIQILPKEFCEAVINTYLFKCKEFTYFQAAVQEFCCKCMIYSTNQDTYLQSVFILLKNYINTAWRNPELRYVGRRCVTYFIKVFCSEFLNNEDDISKETLLKFVNLWDANLNRPDLFDEFLHLHFTVICVESPLFSERAKQLAVLCDSLGQIYGSVIAQVFLTKINYFQTHLLGMEGANEENRFTLIKSLLDRNKSVACLLLVILLLYNNFPVSQDNKEFYNVIMERFDKMPDPIVKMYVQEHFKLNSCCLFTQHMDLTDVCKHQ